jgi:uncharacterized damage-inducible protein DinB
MEIAWIRLLLIRELTAFSRELELFQDESLIWKVVPGVSNSAGTLALHVCGNLQHFLGAVLGHTGYVRNRDLEFADRGVSRAMLLSELRTTADVVDAVLTRLPEDSLAADYPAVPGGYRVATGLFLLHLCAHLAHHLGQAGYLRRTLTGENRSSDPVAVKALSNDSSGQG